MKKFPIRVYSKKELALCYFPDASPHAAVNHLMAWIRVNAGLMAQLESTGYQKTTKWFTPRQVELITDFLGTPGGFE